MSALRFSLRSTLIAGIVGVMSLNAAACSNSSTHPRAIPAARVAGSPGISTTDRAALDSLRAPHQWIADVHHEAMQEVLHDPGISRYTGTGPESPACAAQTRYMERYARRVDT